MSRTLSKILVICALVVVVPLLVVGTTLAAYYSVDSSVVIAAVMDITEEQRPAGTHALVSWNGTRGTSLKVVTGQTNEVEVVADYTKEAFIFRGWFKGNAEAYKTAKDNGTVGELISGEKLTIKMTEASDYVAVYDVVRYTIADWEYKADPTSDVNTEIDPEGAEPEYIYGQTLPSNFDYDGDEYTYEGWQIKGDTTNTRYLTATFGAEYSNATPQESRKEIVLTNPWLEATKVKISYHGENGDVIFTEDVVKSSEAHTLQTPSQVASQVASVELKEGYKYSWSTTANGSTITGTVTPDQNRDVYLQATLATYRVTVEGNYNQTKTLSFTVNDANALADLFVAENWPTEHKFWKVEAVKIAYDNTAKESAQDLREAIITANPHSDAQVTVSLSAETVIHKYFATITAQTIEVKGAENWDSDLMFDEDVYEDLGITQQKNQVKGKLSDNKTESTLRAIFDLQRSDNYTTQDGRALTFNGLNITIGGTNKYITGLTLDSTMLDVLDKLVEIAPEICDNLQDVLNINTILIGFTYEAE